MRYLIIPDVHDKIDTAQRVIDKVPHDRRVFLGDFFDDWETGPRQAGATARWLRQWLHDPDTDVLWGNHDLSYGHGNENNEHICSGFSKNKWRAIQANLSRDDWTKFKLHVWIPGPRSRPWLLTHAGFDSHFLPDGQDLRTTVDARCEFALRSLQSPIPYERGRGHTILGPGHDRGGHQHKGGVTWCDWFSFRPPPGADQLVGHTPGREPKVEDYPDCIAVCLDTSMRHVGLMEDGLLSVLEVAKVLRREE